MDPAVLDRRSTPLFGIDEAALPVRTMSIAGLEGKLTARILSKDMAGPATRIVRFLDGWGSGSAGAFTADVAIFVIRGTIRIGEAELGRYGFASMPQRCVVPGIRAEPGSIALLFTSAPVAYDSISGGLADRVVLVDVSEIGWVPQPGQSGRFVKPILTTRDSTCWLGGALEWSADDGPWHRHPSGEEVFVLEGEVTFAEHTAGEPAVHHYVPGGYLWRPAGRLHAGPGSAAEDTAVTFHRTNGPLETEWLADPADAGASDVTGSAGER